LSEDLERAGQLYDSAAAELDLAAHHCRTAAGHFRNKEVPRGTAHAWAALGHVLEAQQSLHQQARQHATKALP
jgi:hypothetical protein